MNDIDSFMNNHNEIPSHILLEWCDEDESRYELLGKAILHRKIYYSSIADNSSDTPNIGEQGSYSQDLKVWLRSLLIEDLISVYTDSFRELIDTIPPPTKQSETEFFSEQLQIAVDISRKLYPEKPTGIDLDSRTEYYSQRRRIITKLEKEDEKLDKITREALAKIINPVSKKSFTKK